MRHICDLFSQYIFFVFLYMFSNCWSNPILVPFKVLSLCTNNTTPSSTEAALQVYSLLYDSRVYSCPGPIGMPVSSVRIRIRINLFRNICHHVSTLCIVIVQWNLEITTILPTPSIGLLICFQIWSNPWLARCNYMCPYS